MYELQLTQNHTTIVDPDIYALFKESKWCYSHGYAIKRIHNKNIYLHHVLLKPRKGFVIDHVNTNTLDNRRENLRYATKSQNAANAKIRIGTSIYKGVSWDKQMKKWRVSISYEGIRHVIGLFDREHWAAMAYDIAAKDIYGKFSLLNFKQSV